MQELQKQIQALYGAVEQAMDRLQIADLEKNLKELTAKTTRPDFWQDADAAKQAMKEQARLESRIEPWREISEAARELAEFAALNDSSMQQDLQKRFYRLSEQFDALKGQIKLSGPYDDHSAIVGIYAGAGGTDAQDWAHMLMRMYVRWAEKQHINVKTLDQSAGEEAGIKSVTLELLGPFIYGKLKSEHGVHRLVRLSPFNADHLRQTSFAKVEVLPVIERPQELELDEKDLKIDVFRSGGHGGQSVNTTDSAVRITHVPTGISVAIQNERSQLQNKETALTVIRSRLAQLRLEQHQQKVVELKGPVKSAEWGNQIRSYVLHPYKQVKDLRTLHETSDAEGVLDGNLDPFIEAYLEHTIGN